ncbi:MAG: meso-butanediol dehydrogenase / (S,S)-butanediol dehydrogenase / diacetyl reductase [Actinomycetota bacterium]|nr:meso-butanediol dehydrogenase / (S,S)-butanediol dehydrogenase / diacetyl reductase [Actinomycetota bacterium]
MSGRLVGRVALVTGGASGIGAACVKRFADEGAIVMGLDVTAVPESEWVGRGAQRFVTVDVRDEDAISAAVFSIVQEQERLDVVVNAAGVEGYGTAVDIDRDEWERVISVNLTGTFLVCKHVIPVMVATGGGSVVNLSSVEGLEAIQGQPAYSASKGGVVLLTRNLAIDFGLAGVRVNCLCPGLVRTPMTEMLFDPAVGEIRERFVAQHMLGRAGLPDEIAAAALFLASDDASFVTGHALVVDGGFTAGRRLVPPGEAI